MKTADVLKNLKSCKRHTSAIDTAKHEDLAELLIEGSPGRHKYLHTTFQEEAEGMETPTAPSSLLAPVF